MILPLFPFLIVNVPDMSPTDSPPIVLQIPDPATGRILDRFEICIDTIKYADIEFDDFERRPLLTVSLNETGKRQLATLSAHYVGYQSEIAVDGRVIVSPRIMEPLLSGGLQISGTDTIAEAEQLLKAARGRCTLPKAQSE